MTDLTRNLLLIQLTWDYSISLEEIEMLLSGKTKSAGHYTREKLFTKILETYSWFTIIQLFTPEEIKLLLSDKVVKSLRMPSLQNKYGFIQKRLQEIIPVTG